MEQTKKKALDAALANIEKNYGKGALMKLGDNTSMEVEVFSSGSLMLDRALGGGIPKGRIVEVYGPESSGKTTLALHMIAEIQKAGGAAAFIDAEHALDPVYAGNIGVDVDNLYISQPDCGEQALSITEAVVESGAIDIVVVDSVAALVPKSELDGEIGEAHVGQHARLMSQAMRKLTPKISKSGCTVVFINQLREKVGVMYGCLHADTVIPFADGRSFPIRQVVEEKIQGEVWAYDENSGSFVKKPIVDWHYNGDVEENEDYIHIETNAFDTKGGICGITVTPDHRIMTKDGWKKAKGLTIQDFVLSKYRSIVNGTLEDFLYGIFVGDSTISVRSKNTAAIKIQDNVNKEYAEWKVSKLSKFFSFTERKSNGLVRHESNFSTELAIIKKTLGERNPLALLRFHFSKLGLALWYMDDGSFDQRDYHNRASISIKRIRKDPAMMDAVSKAFKAIGLECTYHNDGTFCFDTANTQKLFDMIAEYIPSCMQYKLDDAHKGKYKDFELTSEPVFKEGYLPVKSIRIASDKQMRQRGKYDLTIKDCHNYIAGGISNGILVHNSPETTTGGRALKFYASVRLDVRRKETVKDGGEALANLTKVKVVKNKIAPPFREAEFQIVFGEGISKASELAQVAVAENVISKSGSWFSYGDAIHVQGLEAVKDALSNDHALYEEVLSKVEERLYMPKTLVRVSDSVADEPDFENELELVFED